jgi:hypothetical protein
MRDLFFYFFINFLNKTNDIMKNYIYFGMEGVRSCNQVVISGINYACLYLEE